MTDKLKKIFSLIVKSRQMDVRMGIENWLVKKKLL